MTIPALPDAPALGDSPEVFNTKAFAFVAALDDWGTAANAVAAAVDADATAADADASTATTQAGIATTAAGTATTQAGIATTKAGDAATSANLADASADAANLSAIAADASADAAAASAASIDPASLLTKAGNLSGLASPATARDNLGVEIGVDVQAFNAALAAIAANNGTQMFKNRIINGAMMIDQRNAGGVVTAGHQTNTFPVDRFNSYKDNTSAVVTMQRTTVAPAGFSHSLLVKPTTGSAPTATQEMQLRQSIEGYNVADFNWGNANAVDATLSFWVRSSLTGTFAFAIQAYGSGSTYVTTYTISQADTWEKKTITIPKITTGTWNVDNGATINMIWDLGGGSNYNTTANTWTSGNYYTTAGTTKLIGTTNATFYITGVQLEKGSTATSFDYRPYGTELALCQRYYQKFASTNGTADPLIGYGNAFNTTSVDFVSNFIVQMRSTPTASVSTVNLSSSGGTQFAVTSFANGTFNNSTYRVQATVASGLTTAGSYFLRGNGAGSYIDFSAEL